MSYVQSIERAREETIGREGVSAAALDAMLAKAEDALAVVRSWHADGTLPLLRLPEDTAEVTALGPVVARLQHADDIVFLGTGGSALGGQTVAQLADHAVPGVAPFREGARVHFMDNLDPLTFASFLEHLPLVTARFVAISKSGGTGETLMQTIAVLDALKRAGLESRIPELVFGLSEPAKPGKKNGLRTLLESYGVTMLDHHTGVGGRFSVLTNVGLLPAAALGLDALAIRAGAKEVMDTVLSGVPAAQVAPALGAALALALAEERGKTIAVVMAYADRLAMFTKWYVQLWAESLGKQGHGTTPVGALGPVDQHSQLQLYLDGPKDKFFTVITTKVAGKGPKLDAGLAALAGEPDFAGRTIGDLVAAQGRATADTLAKNGLPTRTIHVERLDERALGALLMHFMLETIIAAQILGIDAFDQPAVEEGKILAKKYLAESA
ncbi:glucose-6-phosphate isomerase [Blastochloris viridis]|uniref:Glucose-6-phosphate isomerase n=1 Tax=Blastochloris viridis TaxID=1079 RepID=A0A0H5BGJ3_BLAVI|nr:glucose-6-phosphate isomerase [Blastochloris viridis]ALK10560.1 Glucose-6-phosphate isomerase [Blastochloris viridis]BAR99486.1 glucose-6-phosphate isomerase [Blastochloris viridis]CUU43222.1 Glucose-6-phosphate isomerase [Blastochloris viridis]